MANEVKVLFTGDPKQLFSVADQVNSRLKTVGQQFQNAGSGLAVSTNLTAPIKKAASEVEAINRQTVANAKQQARLISETTKQRVAQELTDERRLDRERKRFANEQLAEMRRASAAQRSPGPGRASGAASLAVGAAGAFGLGLGFSQFISVADAAIDRAVAGERANRLLASSATEAGLAFGVAAEKNKVFAAQLGLSEQQAAATTASILKLAARAGRPQDADKLLSSFADLGAAQGIDPKDLQTLIGTILSGQDEGLNRLGIADPGQLYKAYAKEIGTTAENLTQMQKVQAAVNAVLEKSAMFAGAASDRMNSLEGRVAKTAAAYDSFKNSASAAFANSPLVTGLIDELGRAFGSLAVNIDEVKKKLSEGKSPLEIAKEQFAGPGATEYLQAFATFLGTGGALGQLLSSTVRDATDPQQIFARNFQTYLDQIQNTANLAEKQNNAAKQNEEALKKKLEGERLVSEEIEKQATLVSTYSKAISDPTTSIAKLQGLRGSATTEITDPKKAAEVVEKIDEAIKTSIEKGKAKVAELVQTYKSAFEGLFSQQYADNPFVKLYTDAQKAQKDFLEQTKGLSKELRNQGLAMLEQQNQLAVFKQKVDTAFTAFDLRDEASRFRGQGVQNQKAESNEDYQSRLINGLRQAGENRIFGGLNLSSEDLLRNRFSASQLQELREKGVSDNALLGSAYGQDELRDAFARNQVSAIPGLTDFNRDSVTVAAFKNAQQRQEQNLSAKDRLDRQFGLLGQFSPKTDDEKGAIDSRIIGISRGVDPATLGADRREQIASAFERQAEREERRQQEALDANKEQVRLLKILAGEGEGLQKLAERGGLQSIEVLVNNKSDLEVAVKRPSQEDTNDLYGLGFGGSF